MIKRIAVVKNSLDILPAKHNGTITKSNKTSDVQYQGLTNDMRIMLNAKTILVKGLRRWR